MWYAEATAIAIWMNGPSKNADRSVSNSTISGVSRLQCGDNLNIGETLLSGGSRWRS
jgi:hypothetical protein